MTALLVVLGVGSAMAAEIDTEEIFVHVLRAEAPGGSPDVADRDEDGIADRAQFRLLDAVLNGDTAPHHALVLTTYTFNQVKVAQTISVDVLTCALWQVQYGFSCSDYINYAAAQFTMGSQAALDQMLAWLQGQGVTLGTEGYNDAMGAYFQADADLDGDGFSNLAEYEASCQDIDTYVTAAMDPAVTPETLPACPQEGFAITEQPQGALKYAGDSHVFRIAVRDSVGEVTYQWYRDDMPIGGSTDTLRLQALLPGDSGVYRCEVQDTENTLVSDSVELVVATHMRIVSDALSAQVLVGGTHTFSVEVLGGLTPLHYVWTRDGVVVGEDAPALTVSEATLADAGKYQCRISDQFEVLASSEGVLEVLEALSFEQQPEDAVGRSGESHTFAVTLAGGDGAPTYQWYKDGHPVGGNVPTLVLSPLTENTAGTYWCVVSNALESVESAHAVLTVVLSCYADAPDCECTPVSIDAQLESSLGQLYGISLIDLDTDTADTDENSIMDGAHARFLDYVLLHPELPIHCCVQKAYQNNVQAANQIADQVPGIYFSTLIARGVFVNTTAGLATIGEKATLDILLGSVDMLPGFPVISPDVFDRSAAPWLAYNGDADRDGVSNAGEFNAVRKVGGNFEQFIQAALDFDQRLDGGGCEPCAGAFRPILLVGGRWAADAYVSEIYEAVLRDYNFPQYKMIGSLTTMSLPTAVSWSEDNGGQQERLSYMLESFPTVEAVHMIFGAEDVIELAMDKNLNSLSDSDLQARLTEIQGAIASIVDYIQSLRNDIPIVLAGMDYLDPALIKAHYPKYDLKSTAQSRFNYAMTVLGEKIREIANNRDNCYYVQNWGVLQYRLGNPPHWEVGGVPYPGGAPGYSPYPGGAPDFPSPSAAYKNEDGWVPTDDAAYWIFENAVTEYYQYWLVPGEVEGEEEGEGEGEGAQEGEEEGENEGEVEGEDEGEEEGEEEGEIPLGVLSISPKPGTTVEFDAAAVDKTTEVQIVLKNTGDAPLSGRLSLVDGTVMRVIGDPAFRLMPEAEKEITLQFTPTARAVYTDVLFITAGTETTTLYLLGKGSYLPFLSCSAGVGTSSPHNGWGDLLLVILLLTLLLGYTRRYKKGVSPH